MPKKGAKSKQKKPKRKVSEKGDKRSLDSRKVPAGKIHLKSIQSQTNMPLLH